MFERIKKLFTWWNKSYNWWFYPISNWIFNEKELNRSDYLNLYLWIQYTAINTISNSVAKLKTRLRQNKNSNKEINHSYLNLINYDLLLWIVSFIELTWSAYIYINKNWNKIDSLELLRTDLVSIIQDDNWIIKWYRYLASWKEILLKKDEVITIDLFNPLQSYPYKLKWVSPMQAVAIQAEMDLSANKWNWNIFKNGAVIWWSLETTERLDKENKIRLISQFKSEFQWTNNAHKVMILDNWLKFNQFMVNKQELDFVESRRFTRDEILAIFKVPKSVLWITDNVNKATAEASNKIFYEVCIEPLAKQIQHKLNETIFKWIWYFEFIDVIPLDRNNLLKEYQGGVITKNEYRRLRWYNEIDWWDTFVNNNILNIWNNKKLDKLDTNIDKILQKHINKNVPWTKEWKEKIWYDKIKRTDKWEIKMIEWINKIFDKQEKNILNQIKKKKKINIKKIDINDYDVLWNITLEPILKWSMEEEWNITNSLLWIEAWFRIWQTRVKKFIKDNIDRIMKDVNNTTKNEILDIISSWNEAWLWSNEIAKQIKDKFNNFKLKRAKTIARTEITNATNEATEISYIDSWVVKEKEFLAELDNRTSEVCKSLNWKRFKLWQVIMKKGESIAWYTNTYKSMPHPPMHPLCRSTLIPVIE